MSEEQENGTKAEAAYRILRTEILMTRLQPGTPLRIDLLSKTYDVGRTPLREALSRLEAERLVVAISNRGFTVAPVSRVELEDLTKARAVVEIPLLLEAMERGGPEWELAIVTAHYRLSRCKTILEDLSDLAVDAWMERHEAFHAALLSAAQSSWLMRFRSTIRTSSSAITASWPSPQPCVRPPARPPDTRWLWPLCTRHSRSVRIPN